VRTSRINWQSFAIADFDVDNLLVYAHDGAVSADVAAALNEAVSRKRKVNDASNRLANLNTQIDQLTSGQSRIRENMKVLDKNSPLYKRYAAELDTQETQLGDLMTKRDAQQAELTKLQNDLADYLSNLTVGDLPNISQ
jgi:chromosome segregation ATPase